MIDKFWPKPKCLRKNWLITYKEGQSTWRVGKNRWGTFRHGYGLKCLPCEMRVYLSSHVGVGKG